MRATARFQERHGLGFIAEFGAAHGLDHVLAVGEVSHDTERRFGVVLIDFSFAVDNDPHPHALHATGTELRTNLFPKHGAQFEPDQTIQDAACLLGIHQIFVHLPRLLNGFEDGGFGDF